MQMWYGGDQVGVKSEMEQLQAFQNRFAKKIQGGKQSSFDALKSLKWTPLTGRRFSHRCISVHTAIKGNIPEHFECYRSISSNSHGYNTRNSQLPRLPKPSTEWGKRTTYYRATNDWASLPSTLKKPMPLNIFKRELKMFLTSQYY